MDRISLIQKRKILIRWILDRRLEILDCIRPTLEDVSYVLQLFAYPVQQQFVLLETMLPYCFSLLQPYHRILIQQLVFDEIGEKGMDLLDMTDPFWRISFRSTARKPLDQWVIRELQTVFVKRNRMLERQVVNGTAKQLLFFKSEIQRHPSILAYATSDRMRDALLELGARITTECIERCLFSRLSWVLNYPVILTDTPALRTVSHICLANWIYLYTNGLKWKKGEICRPMESREEEQRFEWSYERGFRASSAEIEQLLHQPWFNKCWKARLKVL